MTVFFRSFLYILFSNLIFIALILTQSGLIKELLTQNKLNIVVLLVTSSLLAALSAKLISTNINKTILAINNMLKGIFNDSGELSKSSESAYKLDYEFLKLQYSIDDIEEYFQKRLFRLNTEKNQLMVLINAINEGVAVISKMGNITLSNDKFNKLFSIAAEPHGRPYWEVLRVAEINNLIETAIKTKTSITKEINILYPENRIYYINIMNLSSSQSEIIVIFYDITEFKNLEKIKAELVANVSHELRTPLTAIRGYVETLEDGAYDSEEEYNKFLGVIKKHTQRLIDIVSDLLVLSEIEARQSEQQNLDKGEFSEIDINKILLSCKDSLKSRYETKNLNFKIQLQENLPNIEGNQFLLEQAFINLLDNAIKYTAENGTIGFNSRSYNNNVIAEIYDTGIGIPKDSIPRIFERFYRVDKDRSRAEGGTGLGLSIVKHTILLHWGEIRVESELGKGTKFIIKLPAIQIH